MTNMVPSEVAAAVTDMHSEHAHADNHMHFPEIPAVNEVTPDQAGVPELGGAMAAEVPTLIDQPSEPTEPAPIYGETPSTGMALIRRDAVIKLTAPTKSMAIAEAPEAPEASLTGWN